MKSVTLLLDLSKGVMNNMKDQKMGTMPIQKLLLTMAAPMILSMIIGALYNIVDSIFVSNYGEDALTAVSLAFPIQNIIVAVGTGVGVGVNALLSRLLGEKRQEAVNKTAHNGLILSFFVYFILLFFGIFGVKWFYQIQTNESSICQMGSAYLTIICVFSFGQIFQLVLEKLLQSTGRTTYTMVTQLTGAVLNIILDPILIFGYFGLPAMGTAGAATATVIGQIVAMILGINKILLSFSTTATAVFGAYFKLYTFVSMAAFGLNNALISIVAYNLGCERWDRIKHAIKLSGLYSAFIGVIGLVILQVFPKQIMQAFNASATMSSIGITALRITSTSFIFACVSIMVCYALQGLSRGLPSMIISALRQVVILLPLASILGNIFDIEGVWMAFPVTEILVMIAACGYLYRILHRKEE